MKEINELKEKLITRRMKWMRSETTAGYVINDLMDLAIGITEHLEAQEKPCAGVQIGKFMDEGLRAEVRRESMIEALRWVNKNFHTWTKQECVIAAAIARLENGGTLE
jgi:hypothetical protein